MRNLMYGMVFLLAVSFSLSAQNSDSDEALVSVFVVSAMNVEALRGLDFGAVVQGNNAAIPSSDYSAAAQFFVQATSGINIDITFTPPQYLTGPGANIPFTAFDPHGGASSNGAGASELDTDWNGVSGSATIQTTNGEYFIWVGGLIEVANDQEPGIYTGTYLVEAVYGSYEI